MRFLPGQATTTENMGRAVLALTREKGEDGRILLTREINAVATAPQG